MKHIFLVIFSVVLPIFSFADTLENVQILEMKTGTDAVSLKLHAQEGPRGSYFFLDVVKSDPEAFDKMILVIKKMKQKESFRLDIDIPSFSAVPSGAYYRSEGLAFTAPLEREPNSAKEKKKK